MTIEELFDEIAERGLFVNNLFQLDDGTWQCNLRRGVKNGTYYSEFGRGPTHGSAILEAMSKPTMFHEANEEASVAPSIGPSLKDLGLIK